MKILASYPVRSKTTLLDMVVHTCKSSPWKAEAGDCHKFEASLVYSES